MLMPRIQVYYNSNGTTQRSLTHTLAQVPSFPGLKEPQYPKLQRAQEHSPAGTESPCADSSTVSFQILSLYPGQLTARGLEHRNGTLIQPPWFQITFESMKVLFVCLFVLIFFINLVGALLSPWSSPVSLRWRLILVTEDNYFLDIYFNLNIKRREKPPKPMKPFVMKSSACTH